jgi:pilus assembly protein CpaE
MIKHAQHAAVETARMPNSAGDGDDAHIAPAPRVSVQAFCETVETAAAVQAAGDDRRLARAHVQIQMRGITASSDAYRTSPPPHVILIETDNRTDRFFGARHLARSMRRRHG